MKQRAFGTYDIARICKVDPSSVGRWVDEGKLPCHTTAGGHRRVWDDELLIFLKAHNIPIPSGLEPDALMKVLIVDDDPSFRKLTRKIIEKTYAEMRVFEAEDGFEAGRKISSLFPALVVLDIRLPGMDGFRVCQMIRADEQLKHIKILAVSGDSTSESRAHILKSGADDFLAKPFEHKQFLQKIGKLLSIEPAVSSVKAQAAGGRLG